MVLHLGDDLVALGNTVLLVDPPLILRKLFAFWAVLEGVLLLATAMAFAFGELGEGKLGRFIPLVVVVSLLIHLLHTLTNAPRRWKKPIGCPHMGSHP